MAIVLSVLTPEWLLQVSDAPGGAPRSVKLQRHGAPGLLGWAGPMAALDGRLLVRVRIMHHAEPRILHGIIRHDVVRRCLAELYVLLVRRRRSAAAAARLVVDVFGTMLHRTMVQKSRFHIMRQFQCTPRPFIRENHQVISRQ